MSTEAIIADSNGKASYTGILKSDSSAYYYAGSTEGIKQVFSTLLMTYADSTQDKKWAGVFREDNRAVLKARSEEKKEVPDVKGMGLKDALYLLESRDIKVSARGTGKVKKQSLPAGTSITKNQKLILDLN